MKTIYAEHQETIHMRPFKDPVLPVAKPYHPDQDLEDGWAAIDRLDPMACMIVVGGVMEDIPRQYRHLYAWAMGVVLERIMAATMLDNHEPLDRGLKWFLFLQQALLRSPKEKGKEGRGFVAARFNCLAERRWDKLVHMWEEDNEQYSVVSGQYREQISEEEKKEKTKRDILKQLGLGSVSRAVDRITSKGIANMADPRVLGQMKAKHPPRTEVMQDTVIKDSPVSNLRGLKHDLLNLKNKKGSSPGAGGCRPEFLVALAETLQPEKMELLEGFGMLYLRAELPPWFYKVFLMNLSLALNKDNEGNVRPLGVKHRLARSFHRRVVVDNKAELIDYLEPQQLAMSPGGCTKLYEIKNGGKERQKRLGRSET